MAEAAAAAKKAPVHATSWWASGEVNTYAVVMSVARAVEAFAAPLPEDDSTARRKNRAMVAASFTIILCSSSLTLPGVTSVPSPMMARTRRNSAISRR